MKQSWGLIKISSHDISMRVRRKRGARKKVKHAASMEGDFSKESLRKRDPPKCAGGWSPYERVAFYTFLIYILISTSSKGNERDCLLQVSACVL